MKKIRFVLVIFGAANNLFAQPIARESIANSIIGWMKIYHFKGVKEGLKIDNKIYSAKQLSIGDSFANWIQASYIPKGGLGDVKKFVSEKLGLYNQHTAGKPQSYGAYAKTYTELKYNSSHQMVPLTNSNTWWSIAANGIPGDWPIRDICTPTQYYFTLPTASTDVDEESDKKSLDISNNPNIKNFPNFWVKNMGFGGGKECVIIYKTHQSPFIKISKGEFLQALEAGIPLFYEKEKKRITEAEQGDQQRLIIPLKQLDEKIQRFKTGLQKNREKYSNRLNEDAMTSFQPTLIDLDNGRDIFTSQYLSDPPYSSRRYPVYKVDPALVPLCKTDQPQWILVSWDYWPSEPTEAQQHAAITNNFNFEFVYNFFFNPEKTKGQSYQPIHAPATK